MRVVGRAGTWKRRAFYAAAKVVKQLGRLPDCIIASHYSGSGGCIHPDGSVRKDMQENDVAYESLYFDLTDILDTTTHQETRDESVRA